MSRNADDAPQCRPGEATLAVLGLGLGAGPRGDGVSPSRARRDLRGRPGWPGALVAHLAPMWAQRAQGAVLFWARRHCTLLALHWSQAERLTAAGLSMFVELASIVECIRESWGIEVWWEL